MKISLRAFFVASLFASFGASAFSEQMQAVVTKASGKVEVQSGSSWIPISVGTTLEKGAVIQTGFKSTLELKVKGSTIDVAPLTRLTLEQLVAKSNKDETSIYLDTGSVKSNVKKSEDRAVGFKVRSPVATASVRGTVLEVTNKFRSTDVKTHEGTVAVWKSKNSGAAVSSDADDAAPAVLPGEGNSAKDVSADGAPPSAFTVTKGQTAGFQSNGGVSNPMNNAAKTAHGFNAASTQSAGAAEAESAPGGQPPMRPAGMDSPKSGPTTGNISVTVTWEE